MHPAVAPRRERKLGPHVVLLLIAVPLPLFAQSQSPANGAWQSMRPSLYGTRDIGESGDELMSLEAPGSTPDPTATPVVLHFGPALQGKVKQVRVIIDNNRSPPPWT